MKNQRFVTSCLALFHSVIFLFVAFCPDAIAAPVVQRRIQAQKAAQQQMIQQYQQQMIAQQQAQQVAAYQQAVAQRQVMVQQQAAYQKAAVEYAAYKEAMQQALAQRNAELQAAAEVKAMIAQKQAAEVSAVQQAVAQKQAAAAASVQQAVAYKRASEMVQYKQAIEARTIAAAQSQAEINQEIGQYTDFLVKRKAALAAQGIQVQQVQTAQQLAQYNQYQQVRAAQAKAAVASKQQAQEAQALMGAKIAQDVYKPQTEPEKSSGNEAAPETVVDIKDLWKALDVASTAWDQIIDNEIKVLTVAEYIDRFKRIGIIIKKAPGYYVNVINSIASQDPGYLAGPFMNVLSYAAILDYDFDNGQNKDELARRVLGEENFKANRARLQRK